MAKDLDLLRHSLAVVAYRAGNALRGSDDAFATFDGAGRTPAEILAHMGDLFDWALAIARGQEAWREAQPLSWADEQQRFFHALTAFDQYLASEQPLHADVARLLQGPVADALTHIGQLAMLRRMAGRKIPGENFYVADMHAGCTTAEQAPSVKTF